MSHRLLRGLARGLQFGLFFIFAETFMIFSSAILVMEMPWDPFNATVFTMMGISLLMCGGIGALLALVAGPFLAPGRRYLHAIPLTLLLLLVTASPNYDQYFWLGIGSVALAHGSAIVVSRMAARRRIYGVAFATAGLAAWVTAMLLIRPAPLDHPADPNRPKPVATAPNVLWVVMDTTRSDHLSVYGYHRPTTPHLEALAREGAVFDKAYSTAPWTVASHAAMFTGLYSSQHGCNHEHLFLDPTHTTLAQLLTAGGYETALFAGNPWLADQTGLARGYMHIFPSWRFFSEGLMFIAGRMPLEVYDRYADKGAATTNASFKAFMAERPKDRPFFAFINYLEPHAPYHHVPTDYAYRFLAPDASRREARKVSFRYIQKMMAGNDYEATPAERVLAKDMYDGALSYTDQEIGELIDVLRAAGQLDNTLVIVNGDHGELFGEHGIYGHDLALYHPLLHVPLIVRYPGRVPAGVRIDRPVQLIDVFPTVLEVAGLADRAPQGLPGHPLTGVIAGGGDPARPVFAEYFSSRMRPLRREVQKWGFDPDHFRLKSVQVGTERLMTGPGDRQMLTDVATDPDEEKALEAERPETAQRLKEALIDVFGKFPW
jgi:arylsulfatase A-like enzyme